MRRERAARDERGAAVVLALALVAVLVLVAGVCVGTVAILLAHRRAQVAADLSSLAAAGALQRGDDACAAATLIAGRHGAVVRSCSIEGTAALVTTVVALPPALGGEQLAARARAGPVSSSVGN